MFDHIPVGVGSKGIIPMNARDLEEALEMGMDWSLREGQNFVVNQNVWFVNRISTMSSAVKRDSLSCVDCLINPMACIVTCKMTHIGQFDTCEMLQNKLQLTYLLQGL
jgi:hypothetical protein